MRSTRVGCPMSISRELDLEQAARRESWTPAPRRVAAALPRTLRRLLQPVEEPAKIKRQDRRAKAPNGSKRIGKDDLAPDPRNHYRQAQADQAAGGREKEGRGQN